LRAARYRFPRCLTSLQAAPTTGGPALFERLIDNEVRHNDERGWLEITTAASRVGSTLSVMNTGAVIPGD
jgi:hypothetical protein